jgi:nicotinate-nucleotide adenylyltransferase
MNLCLYQGTFNPIHNAHLKVARYAVEHFATDGVLFIPAFVPPHKESDPDMALHRFNMVKLAISDNKNFSISDIEYKRSGKSYTYLTVCELYKQYKPSERIKFLIGTDAFRKIESWYEADKLKDLLEFYVFKRDKSFDVKEFDFLKEKGYKFNIMPMAFDDISSSEIRERILNKMPLKGLVSKKVEEYINKYDLYK